jgi:RES domain-containing protein
VRFFRLTKTAHSPSVLGGAGGLVVDGRWHPIGHRIVYCASSEALAVLELRVHLGRVQPSHAWTMHEIDVPDDSLVVAPPESLPPSWNRVPPGPESQKFGSAWLTSLRSLALRVPSVHSVTDHTILLNPAHPQIGRVRVLERRPYRFDGRLFQG